MLLASCKPSSDVPAQFEQLEVEASLFPDYKNVVVPPNIAPMNFLVEDSAATAFVVELKGGGSTSVKAGAGEDGKVLIDSIAWRQLLQENKGAKVMVGIYAQHGDSWVKYREHFLEVAEDDIDSYLNYRLIEPGYELFRQLGLYQRNTTNWDVQPIYENNRVYDVNDQLVKYKVDKLIMGMDGVDLTAGATSYNHVEDAIMRQMIAQANYKILVADDSKIGKITFAHIAELSDFDVLVTNYSEQNEELIEEIRATGMQVIVV